MKQLSIVIPVYNEEKRIKKTLLKLSQFISKKHLQVEVLIIDDGSTDKTIEVINSCKKKYDIIEVKPNRGKGNAIRAGMLRASGTHILFMDADLATPLKEIEKFLCYRNSGADIWIGSRVFGKTKVRRNIFRKLFGVVFRQISDRLVPLTIKDTQCGFKMFTQMAAKEIFGRSKIDRWSFDVEILYLAQKLGFVVQEIPVDWEEKSGSKVRIVRDSLIMIRDLLRIRIAALLNKYDFKKIRENNYDRVFENAREAERY